MSNCIAMLFLQGNEPLPRSAWLKDVCAQWPELDAELDVGKNPQGDVETVSMTTQDGSVVAGVMPAPLPSDLKGLCGQSWLWRNSYSTIKTHTRHVIVTSLGGEDGLVNRRLLTKAIASMIRVWPSILGVYWCDAEMVIMPKMFRDFAKMLKDDLDPLHVWVNFQLAPTATGAEGFTVGLNALELREFETKNSYESPADLLERMIGLTFYLLENGQVIKNGDTIGASADEKIKVIYGKSRFGTERDCMILDYAPKRPR